MTLGAVQGGVLEDYFAATIGTGHTTVMVLRRVVCDFKLTRKIA